MPTTCCVTGCRGNYDENSKVSVFKFPDNPDLLQKWIQSIPRQGFKPSKYSRVCILHFQADYVSRVTEVYDNKTGEKISVPLKYPRLTKDAIPTIFPNCPSYLSTSTNTRESVVKKKERIENLNLEKAIAESLQEMKEKDTKMAFSSFKELCEKVTNISLPSRWSVLKESGELVFFNLILNPEPVITKSIVVNDKLALNAYVDNVYITKLNGKHIPSYVKRCEEISSLLDDLNNYRSNAKDEFSSKIQTIIQYFDNLLTNCPEDKVNNLKFLKEQCSLLTVKKERHRYTSDLLIFSALFNSISPHAYRFLLSSQNLILPHQSTLRRLSSSFNFKPQTEQHDSNFLSYISSKFLFLNEVDTIVVLMMDEIHINSFFEYKGGSICGASHNTVQPASTAYVFMIQSLLSKFKDVVHILPVASITALELFEVLKKIIVKLEGIGFNVVCIVSDNNSINSKAVSYFVNPPKISIVYPHPIQKSKDNVRPIFFAIDSPHIIKCVRNNWINQKNQCLYYPDFEKPEESTKLNTANFHDLKRMHELESSEPLVKYGHGLTLKCLNPSNLERQNVGLALRIFNEHISSGLTEFGLKHNIVDHATTSNFIDIMTLWFKIVNVKTPYKGIRLKDILQRPITINNTDERRVYLELFLTWLDVWKEKNISVGHFSRETQLALSLTTHTILELSKYCIEELNFTYFLPGKVQTDALEDRFGFYRRLSGSQYNIGLTQLYESESKLRMRDFLPLIIESKKFGNIPVNTFSSSNENEIIDSDSNNTEVDKIIKNMKWHEIKISRKELADISVTLVLTYLAGYGIHQFIKNVKCENCKENLTLKKDLQLDDSYKLILNIDRGGLLCPIPDIVTIVSVTYLIVRKLVSEEHENNFLKMLNQRSIVIELSYNMVLNNEYISYDQCKKGHSLEMLTKKIVKTTTNILLKNYCQHRNDKKKTNSKSRKLQTLCSKVVSSDAGVKKSTDKTTMSKENKHDQQSNSEVVPSKRKRAQKNEQTNSAKIKIKKSKTIG